MALRKLTPTTRPLSNLDAIDELALSFGVRRYHAGGICETFLLRELIVEGIDTGLYSTTILGEGLWLWVCYNSPAQLTVVDAEGQVVPDEHELFHVAAEALRRCQVALHGIHAELDGSTEDGSTEDGSAGWRGAA